MRIDLLPTTFEGKLYRLTEECGEVLKAVGKIGRFGHRPIDGKTGIEYDNIKDLKDELQDLKHAIDQVEREIR